MARGAHIVKRQVEPDSVYQSRLVTKLINRSMIGGKKTTARGQVYQALEKIAAETKRPAMDVFNQALENIKPAMEVRPRRIGGAAYQVPMPVRGDRRESLAVRWLIRAARARSNKECPSFGAKLAAEIMAAANNEGSAIQKRNEIHRMAEANKAFAHFRW